MLKLVLFIIMFSGFSSYAGISKTVNGNLVKKTATQVVVEDNRNKITVNMKDIKSKRDLASIKKAQKGTKISLALPLKAKVSYDAKKLGAK